MVKIESVKHYRNPRNRKRTMCGHDCTIPGRTYSNTTNRINKVTCKGCIAAIRNNKHTRQKLSKRFISQCLSEQNSRNDNNQRSST